MARRPSKEAKASIKLLLDRIREDVATLAPHVLRDLAPVLAEAERETASALARWLSDVPNGNARFTAHQYRQVLLQLRHARAEVAAQRSRAPAWVYRMRTRVAEALGMGGVSAGVLATKHVMQELATFHSVFEGGLTSIPLDNAALFANGQRMLVPRFETSARRYAGAVWDDMKRQLAIGAARNESIEQMLNRLRRLGGPKTASAPEGLFRRYRYWAERLARTEVINAYNVHHNEGIMQLNRDDPGYTKRWDASADSRLCANCRSLDGTVVGVDEEFLPGVPHPPLHPNCRCTVLAWRSEWDDGPVGQAFARITTP